MVDKIISFRDLNPQQKKHLAEGANWKVDGEKGDWNTIIDPRYGIFQHVVVIDESGEVKYDKVNLRWTSGVYVATVRINPEGKAEFLLPSERRILLRNNNGQQGDVFVDGIPQGIIKEWAGELPHKAALRELIEETGYAPTSLVFLGNIALNPANSETEQPFYLAHIPYIQTPEVQILEESETIHTQDRWFTWRDIQGRPWKDGITVIGLALAQRVLKPELL
jgi:ADP-ribose pyrophosphatase YjhB (NUDIX family)